MAIGSAIPIAGALIGECGGGVILERCSNTAHVRVDGFVEAQDGGAGGLVGKSTSNSGSPAIRECANFGPVEAKANVPVGGIIGHVGTESGTFAITLVDTFNYGPVTSPLAAGGLIGRYRGVASVLRNNGNSGAIRCDTCWAGGFVGFISFNDNNRTWRIRNALQAGEVITYNGFAGIVVGGFEESIGSGLTMVVSNVVMAGSATVTSYGGKTGLLIAGRDTNSQYDTAFVVEDSCVLTSNAALPHYYDKDNAPASLATAPATIGPRALRDGTVRKQLDRAAESNGWMRWIAGKYCPELALFGTQYGYMAWSAEKGIDGEPWEKTLGIENVIRYAFDIDSAEATVGDPIIKVVFDANGHPSVQARALAEGRDDVTFDVLATEDLTDWDDATRIRMRLCDDGFWRPVESEDPNYVFPPTMFYRFMIDVK